MTPKEKALDLFHKYARMWHASSVDVKQCCIIAVDEILASFETFMDSRRNFRHELEIAVEAYYKKVKEEIEKL